MLNPWPVVAADIRRSRSGFLAVVGLIAVAVSLGVAISAQERALRTRSARAADAFDLLVGAPGSPTQLALTCVYLQPAALPLVSGTVLKRLQKETGAAYVAPIAFGERYRDYPVVGSTSAFATRGGTRASAEGRVFMSKRETVVGAAVSLREGDRFTPSRRPVAGEMAPGDPDADHDRHDVEYMLVGRMPRTGTPWDRAIIVPVETIWKLHGLPSGHSDSAERIGPPWDGLHVPGASVVVVKPRTVADAHQLRGKYRADGMTALFPAELFVDLYGILGDEWDLLTAISVATLALVIAAVLLAVFASLALRRRQLAVLRALGASRGYVFAVVWTHVSLMIALGAFLGLGLGWAGAAVISASLSARSGIALSATLAGKELAMAAAVLVIGMLLAVIPSWSSCRESVSSGLRT